MQNVKIGMTHTAQRDTLIGIKSGWGIFFVIVYMTLHKEHIQHWGWWMIVLAVYGLVLCCYAAIRDGLDKTIQCAIDGSVTPDIFSLVSIPTIVGCIGAAMIIV